MTVEDIIKATNGKLIIGNLNETCENFCTDTRKIQKDDVYIGLKGEKFNSPSATTFANQLITVLSVIGSVLSVIVLIVLGIKYMMGSVEEKATYKKSLMPYVIGAALVFAASAIAGIFYNIID